MAIDPHDITCYTRTEHQLQEFCLFTIVVAGKNSNQQSKKLEQFLTPNTQLPFETIKNYLKSGSLIRALTKVRMGQYKRISKAFEALATSGLDLRTCSIADLEKIPGLYLKTSRFFIVHSRPDQEYAILDSHLLRHMRENLGIKTPKVTPTNPKVYYALEKQLQYVVRASGKTMAQYDLEVWSKRVKAKGK